MRNLMVTSFVSLDGVVQAPGGPDEDLVRAIGVTARADALLLGRRTYEEFAATWPLAAADDPIGSKWAAVRKYVASRTLTSVTWQNSVLLEGDVADAVAGLKKSDGGEIQVHGSGQLVQTLLAHDLVDELHLVVIPVLIGSGKRLFGSGTVPARFDLVAAATTRSGVVVGRYARAGGVTYGAVGPETGNW
jgi:dihydrofolate reductase